MATVGLLVGLRPPRRLTWLIAALGARHVVVAGDPAGIDAVIWHRDESGSGRHAPTLAWITGPDDEVPDDTVAVACDTLAAAERPGAIVVPDTTGDGLAGNARPVAAFTRSLIRKANRLPGPAVAVIGPQALTWDGQVVADHYRESVLGSCAAAVATGDDLVRALAWGTPTVTDPESAAEHGVQDGVHVVVGADPDERVRLAGELASDDLRGARLAQAARAVFEARMSASRAVLAVETALGLTHGPDGWESTLRSLGAWPDSTITTRMSTFMAPFPVTAAKR